MSVQLCLPGCCDGFEIRHNFADFLIVLHYKGRHRSLPYNATSAQIKAAMVELEQAS